MAKRNLYPVLIKDLAGKRCIQEVESEIEEGGGKKRKVFLRKWTAQGRMIAARRSSKSRSSQSASLNSFIPSRNPVEVVIRILIFII